MLITKKLIERSTWVPDLSSTQQKSLSFKYIRDTRDNQFNHLAIAKPSKKLKHSISCKKTETYSLGRWPNPNYYIPSYADINSNVWTIRNTDLTSNTTPFHVHSDSSSNPKPLLAPSTTKPSKTSIQPIKSKILRRKNQRRKKRLLSTLELSNSQATKRFLNHKIIQLKNNFGFIANPNKKLQYNFFEALHQLDTSSIINTNNHQLYTTKTNLFQLQPKNLSMHNLCQEIQLPIGTKNLLGLGLKFCTAPPIPAPNIKDTLKN